ncbi:MAG: hypothetical protein NT147_03090 [Candidatus Aminicenantes bacterium]|nr:hypothetical protein [Candidatus Aminicenantes bacterium]
MSKHYADYYELHESRESICAPDHVPECSLCHEDNAERTVVFEGKEVQVCLYCFDAIRGFEQGSIS